MKILVPVDGSKYALKGAELALDLAKAKGAGVTLLSVVPSYHIIDLEISARARDSLEDKLTRQAEEALALARKYYVENGLTPQEVLIRSAAVADEIVKMAEEGKFELIVIGSRGLGATGRFFLGGTALKVVSHAPCSVLVAKMPE
jgi:nucleotide-binding universal stress UspA family protein